MLRRCDWNHKDLPYKPARPCFIVYFLPGNPVPRAVTPNARGEFTTLVPGLPYREWEAVCSLTAVSLPPKADFTKDFGENTSVNSSDDN